MKLKNSLGLVCLLGALLSVAGCVDLVSDATAGCDLRQKGADSNPRCQERIGLVTAIESFKALCDTGGLVGKSVDGQCPREGMVGGCRVGSGANDTVDYYYTADDEGESEY